MEEDFLQTTKESWATAQCKISLPEKLKTYGNLLFKWAEETVGNTRKKIQILSKEIEDLHYWEELHPINEADIVAKKKEMEKLLL